MSLLVFLAVAAAGGVGAACRFVLDGALRPKVATYPIGTTVINLSGSFLLGLLTGLAVTALLPAEWRAILGTGLLGGYTTFSTASVETVRLLEQRRRVAALVNGIGMLVAGVALAAAGFLLATGL